jgi:hypothetical protein
MLALTTCVLLAFPVDPTSAQPVCAMSFINPNVRCGVSPSNSSVPPIYQFSYSATLIDALGLPVAGWPGADVGIMVGPPCPTPQLILASGVSSPAGVVVWSADDLDVAGGACLGPGPIAVVIVSLGCALPTPIPYLTSPDIDGNGLIALNDLGIFRNTFVMGGPVQNGDYSRDGIINLVDVSWFQRHFLAP